MDKAVINLAPFNMNDKRKLIKAIKAVQPEASNRALADMTGVSKDTIQRENGAFAPGKRETSEAKGVLGGAFAPPDKMAVHYSSDSDEWDTGWWWDCCRYGEIRFLRGRLRFGGGGDSGAAPFPSAIVIFGTNWCHSRSLMCPMGHKRLKRLGIDFHA